LQEPVAGPGGGEMGGGASRMGKFFDIENTQPFNHVNKKSVNFFPFSQRFLDASEIPLSVATNVFL
jgi:hypothetical protein